MTTTSFHARETPANEQSVCDECQATEPNVWPRSYWGEDMTLCQWCWQKYAARD
jgi:hypothetical protein